MAKIQYVGLKDQEIEHLYGSGQVFRKVDGVGEIHEIPDAIASKMLNHPDVYKLVEGDVAASVVIDDFSGFTKMVDTLEDFDPAEMTKADIQAYAIRNFGREVEDGKKAEVLGRVQNLVNLFKD